MATLDPEPLRRSDSDSQRVEAPDPDPPAEPHHPRRRRSARVFAEPEPLGGYVSFFIANLMCTAYPSCSQAIAEGRVGKTHLAHPFHSRRHQERMQPGTILRDQASAHHSHADMEMLQCQIRLTMPRYVQVHMTMAAAWPTPLTAAGPGKTIVNERSGRRIARN